MYGSAIRVEFKGSRNMRDGVPGLHFRSTPSYPVTAAGADFEFFLSDLFSIGEDPKTAFFRHEKLARTRHGRRGCGHAEQCERTHRDGNSEDGLFYANQAVTFGKIPSARICSTTREGSVLLSTR